MGWEVPGYRADTVEESDDDLESWRGIDEATGTDVLLRRMRGRAGDLDEADWRSAAINEIGYTGLVAPRELLCDGDDLVAVYDAVGTSAAGNDRTQAAAYVAALVCAVAGELHALHAAGMTHGSVGAMTVRRDDGELVLVGAVESGLRGASSDDTALDDVRALAALGLALLGPAARSVRGVSRALSTVLTAAIEATPSGDDPCDPTLSAQLKSWCEPYVDDEPTERISQTRPGEPVSGDYVARHLRAPTPRWWTRVGGARTRRRNRRRVVAARSSNMAGPATGIAVVAVLVAIAAWMGTVWGDEAAPQGSAPMAATQRAATPSDTAGPDASDAPGAFDAGSASPAQWGEYLRVLYLDRAIAINGGTAGLLDRVYVPTSAQLAADLSLLSMLTDTGARVVGFAPQLVAVNDISRLGQTTVVSVVDRIPPYTLVDAAGVATTHAGRGEQVVSLTLELAGGRWLIDTAIRVA